MSRAAPRLRAARLRDARLDSPAGKLDAVQIREQLRIPIDRQQRVLREIHRRPLDPRPISDGLGDVLGKGTHVALATSTWQLEHTRCSVT